MSYLIASFASRNETLTYAKLLKNNGLQASIINTPAGVSQGCTISVRLPYNTLAFAQRMLNLGRFTSFLGFFTLFYQNGREVISRI